MKKIYEVESNDMYKNTQEKSLVEVKNKSIFDKIKSFFKNIFSSNSNMEEEVIDKEENHKEEDLTKEQVESLCTLYDNKILRLRKYLTK